MLRYYMTPETQQALIAESNRQIARRAAMNAARRERSSAVLDEASDSEARRPDADQAEAGFESDSAFARLVADLQLTSVRHARSARP
jgi:hypothetical protein